LPAAAAAKKPRSLPGITLWKNTALKKAQHAQETYESVNVVWALEYIGCEDAVQIFCDSIDIDDYKQRRFYIWAHILVFVSNYKLNLPAFETEHAPLKFLAWFRSATDKSNTALEELGCTALELI